mgnify:CR=1 FL=1
MVVYLHHQTITIKEMRPVEIRLQIMQLNRDLVTYAYDTVKFESILCEIENLKRKLYAGQPQVLKHLGL